VTKKNYADQAKFFLNAFWPEHSDKAEEVWGFWVKIVALDLGKGKEGNELDEFNAHRFLEQLKETKTVIEMRNSFKEIDLDNNKRMALIEYLVFKYKVSIKVLLSRPQGTNEDLVKAQKALDEVNAEIARIEGKKTELEKASAGSGVKAMQAKNELQQLLTADNTSLNRILLTAEATIRKAQKQGNLDAQGALFWIDRELQEAKKYKPTSRGGVAK